MAVPDLDPRTGGACVKCLSNKFCAYVLGYFQLVIWVIAFFTLVFHPSSVSTVIQDVDTAAMVIAGFIALFCVLFSVILLIGLHKDRRLFVKSFCIFLAVLLVLLMFSLVINIFVQPKRIGFRGFFSTIINILFNIFTFFVIRSYYLVTYCNNAPQRVSNDFKV